MSVMAIEKKQLSFEDIEAQTAMELPDRETPQFVVITCLAICVGQIILRDIDVAVALDLCAQINAVSVDVLGVQTGIFSCEVRGGPIQQ
jgi:hypothetical protein